MSNYKTVDFHGVSYVGCCNCRLILSPKYTIDGEELVDRLFIYYGKIKSADGVCHLTKEVIKGAISHDDYERVRDLIMPEINEWCRNLGFLEVTGGI